MGLKVQYRRPILTLCDGNYNRLGILSNKTQRSCYNVNLTKKVNEVSVLSFDIPSDNLIDYNSTELLVKFGLDYYIIKDVTLSSTDKSMYSVSAEHESTELKGILVSMISEEDSDTEIIGESPEGMWSLLVDSCSMPEIIKNKYIFETDIVDTYRSLEVEDEKGLYEHLVNIAKQFEACLVFEHNEEGKILIKLVAGEIDNKRVVKKGKDLRQLNITLDSSAIFTKIIPFGAVDKETGLEINIMDVTQDGKSYVTNYDYYLDQGMTLDEIKNTPKCNQECIYRNSDIVDVNELLRIATKELEQISKPVLHGNVDIINLGCMEGYFENIPVLCEKIYVADKVGKYNIFSKVVGVSINYDNPLKSKVEISNVVRYSSTFADIVRTSEVVSKVTTKKKGKPVLSAEKVQGIIDAHTTQIKNKLLGGAEHQGDKLAILFEDVRIDSDTYGAIALGTSGILISNEKDINGEWLWTTAIDSQGLSTKIVNAITINGAQVNAGKISSFDGSSWWNLDNNEFNFGDKIKFIDGTFSIELGNGLENLVTKEDLEEVKDLIDEVDERLDTALGDIDRAFKEGIIGEVEKRVIEKTLKTLLDQYSNAEYLYEIYKVSENLADETKTTLNARWRLYDASYTELTNYINEIIADEKCTETELVSYNLKVEEYYARYSELKNLLEDCQIEASNNYTNTKVSISEGNIKTEIESKYVKVDEAVNYTVICDNEHQGIPVDMLRKPLTTNTYRFNIAIYKGGAGTQQEFTIDSITGTGSGITYTKYDKYITMKVSKDTAISDLEGSIDVALTCNGFKFNKKITWNAVLNGEKGDSAEVVSIEASSLIFKYNNETQVYSPTNITLNPVFKNCAFQSWKYSINGGVTYNTLATIDGITKDTNNKLTISSTCALFTSSVTSIQFKVTSSVGTTDQVTLTRLRDGVDGLDGLAGEKGADGKTYYTWVKYADTPTSGMSELPDGKTYIGLAYNKETNVESTNYADYKWSLIKGENGLDGEKGKDGKTYYTWLKYADTPTSGMSDDPTNKKYMGLAYNKESKIESTNYADYSWSLIKGNDGTNAINVVLSNESHTFVADHYGCPIPTSITNNVYGYSGTKQVNTNIGEIIGLPEGMSITVKNNNTTNTQIIINVAETMRIESGTISIPVICNGVTINKVFTYSLAKNGVDAKIVVINATSQVFKSTDGGVNYTPNSITVIASYQNCSHSKWQYSTNNDLTFRDLTNGTGGITVNGTTLTIPKTCSLFTSTSNCINIKAIGVDENVYDTVTIFKLLDRADINDVLDEQNSKITTVEEKYSTLEQDLNGFKTEVGQTYTTIEEFGQLEVGATNLIRNANFDLGLNAYWTNVGSQSNLITLLPPENDKPTSNILSYNVSGNTSPISIYKFSNPIPIEWDENGVAEFILRFEIKSEDWSVVDGAGIICIVRTFVDSDKIAGADCIEGLEMSKSDIDTTNNDWQTVVKRIRVTNNTAKYIKFGSYCAQNSNCRYREFMAVKGNRIASTFSINPSDAKEYVDGEIEDYTQTITREYQSAIEQTKNDITLSVSETYATKTEIEQMVIGGGDNLLRNGNFADGLDHWKIEDFDTAGTSKAIKVTNTPSVWIPKNKNVLIVDGLNTNERYGVGSDIMKLAPYTKYVISGYCAGHRINEIKVVMRDVDNGHTPIVNSSIPPVRGGDSLSKWYRFEIPFTTTANGNYVLCLYSGVYNNNDGSGLASSVWFTDVQVEEGTKATPWKKCIYDVTDGIDDVSNSVTNLNNYIDGALQDKILDKTERQAIEQQLKVLEAEKADINKEYTALNSNAKLTGTPKTTLTSAYNDYIAKYNSLVTSINNILNAEDITVALKNSYNTAYTNHNNSLATYRQAYIDAFNSITTNYIETMKQALLKEIDEVQDSVDNLNTYVDGAFKDGILDNAEKHAIKQQLKTLSSEKADIDNEYTVVINDSDLTGTPKTNLTNAYNNYVSKYNSLVTSINNILNATLVTPTLRNSYDTAYTNHNSALATLKQRHTEAINAIAEAKVLDCTETITREYQSAIEQTKNEITLSVSETYATKTEMEQIGRSGGDNLLRNGNFADGLDHWAIDNWDNAGTSKSIKVANTPSDWIPKNKNVLEITGLNTNERYGVKSDTMKLAPYTKYVVSGYCAGHRVDKIIVTVRDIDNGHAHVVSKDISPVSGGNNLSKWYRFEIPFTTTANGNYNLCLYSRNFNADGSTSLGYVWFTDVQIEEGTKATPWKKCIYDVIENIDDVSNSVTNLNNYIDGAFKDGILDNTEKRAIEQQIKTLSAEKADIENEYTTVINNADLTGTPKTNLTNAYNDYISKYIALMMAINNVLDAVLVTPTLKDSYDTAYNNHNKALATLKQRHMEAINAIAETKKQSSITTSKTYTDAQLSLTANAIRGTVSELREDFEGYQGEVSSTYATKSEMELTSEQFKVTFQKSGSGNLLKNSDCQFGLNGQWVNNGGGLDRAMADAKPFVGSREPYFKTSFPNGIKYSEPVYLKPNTDYVYQAYVYVDSSMSGAKLSPVHFWSWVAWADSSPTAGQDGLTILDYKQDLKVGEFSLCYIRFKTIMKDVPIGFLPFIYASGTVSHVAVKQICLKEGKTPSIWIPHSSEINEGITTINEHGIQVSHSNINTKTRMTADGFYFVDENDDIFASLSTKETWASLRVQEVFANNIENIYTGSATLYVDHSKTVAGTGSSLLPFNSFGILKEYLERMPIINKDLTIYVQNPNAEINEVLSLANLKGTGWLKIVFDKNCVLRSNEYAISLNGINKFTIIEGGRSSYSSSDGAVILDKGNQSGISINDCKDVYVNSININCKNFGIRANKSRLRTRIVDFGQTYCAIQLDENCQCYDGDSCGNCSDFVRAVTGSIFIYGASANGICPFGNKVETSGKVFLVGSARTQKGSYKYPSSSSTPSTPATSTYTQTFKATKFKTYQYAWSNWGDGQAGGCIQGAYGGYGNKAGHVFFDLSSIRSFLGSGTVGSCTITITRRNGGGSSGATNIYINASSVTGASGTPAYSYNSKLGTLTWGESKTFNLSSNIVNALKSSAGSIAFYSSSDTGAYAEIVACSITLKVTK